jgi:UTP--glucose-1-phosphate uridylyltransferase
MADSTDQTTAAPKAARTGALTKAVIPAAGLGTRFLPFSKATPKEMLPVIDTPVIEMIVQEASAAGLTDVLMVTRRGKPSIEDHFDRAHELEEALTAKDDKDGLALIRASAELASMHYVRQAAPRGLGHAVLCAAEHVGQEPFAVLLGDDLIDPGDPLLRRMIEVRRQRGGSVVALMEVEPDQVSSYGVVAMKPAGEDDVVEITDMVEKPSPDQAPSNWIIIGRYVCDPSVFDVLRQTEPGRGGEIQLTDALRVLAGRGASQDGAGQDGAGQQGGGQEGGGVHGVLFRGRRFDTGNKIDYLRTLVQFGCERPDLAGEFVPWLRGYLGSL